MQNLLSFDNKSYKRRIRKICKQILSKRPPASAQSAYGPHGWLGWLVVLYAVCMMLDWVTGTVLAIKNGVWSSHKARQGLWHKCGSIIMIFVSVLTDILLGLTLNHISGLTLPFNYDMLLTPIVLFWYIVSELGSILENAEKMGAPIPPLLKNFLEKMRDSNDDKNTPSL